MAATLKMRRLPSRRSSQDGRERRDVRSRANLVVAVAVALLVCAVSARAHHSVPVNFDQSKEITISGTLTEAKWINPHSRFRIDVKQDDGKTVEWLVEMGAVNTMRRAGFEIEKFVVGDTLTIIGWPGRGRDRTMLLRTAVLKDGTRLSP
jgi:Family of unknown function (DUF6152)